MLHSTCKQPPLPLRIFRFYRDGFASMTLGRTLWKIIFIKLFIMFAVLKLFFFPDYLATNFSTDQQRVDHVISQITQPAQGPNITTKGEEL